MHTNWTTFCNSSWILLLAAHFIFLPGLSAYLLYTCLLLTTACSLVAWYALVTCLVICFIKTAPLHLPACVCLCLCPPCLFPLITPFVTHHHVAGDSCLLTDSPLPSYLPPYMEVLRLRSWVYKNRKWQMQPVKHENGVRGLDLKQTGYFRCLLL